MSSHFAAIIMDLSILTILTTIHDLHVRIPTQQMNRDNYIPKAYAARGKMATMAVRMTDAAMLPTEGVGTDRDLQPPTDRC